jgi:hypothetical protein
MAPDLFESGRGKARHPPRFVRAGSRAQLRFPKVQTCLPQPSTPWRNPHFMVVPPVKNRCETERMAWGLRTPLLPSGCPSGLITAKVFRVAADSLTLGLPCGRAKDGSPNRLGGKCRHLQAGVSEERGCRTLLLIGREPSRGLHAPQSLANDGLHGPPLRAGGPYVSRGGQGKPVGHIWSRQAPLGISVLPDRFAFFLLHKGSAATIFPDDQPRRPTTKLDMDHTPNSSEEAQGGCPPWHPLSCSPHPMSRIWRCQTWCADRSPSSQGSLTFRRHMLTSAT